LVFERGGKLQGVLIVGDKQYILTVVTSAQKVIGPGIIGTTVQMNSVDAVLYVELVPLKRKMTQGIDRSFLYNLIQIHPCRFPIIFHQGEVNGIACMLLGHLA
jgi:hypothetical protein